MKLGKTQRAYQFTNNTQVLEGLARASEKHLDVWYALSSSKNLIEVAEKMHAILQSICAVCPHTIPAKSDDAYVRTFTVRKVALACAVHNDILVDWNQVSIGQLQRMAPDENEFLNTFPESWTAEQVSSLVFDRPDWAIFASMFACLFHEVAEVWPSQHRQIIAMMQEGQFEAGVHEIRKASGVTPTPYGVAESLLPKRTPRATSQTAPKSTKLPTRKTSGTSKRQKKT